MFRRSGSPEQPPNLVPKRAEAGNRYRMVENLIAFGDDFFVQNDRGERIFKVDGKALRLRDTLKFQDMQGNEICRVHSQVARVRNTMEIEGPAGNRLALVQKAMVTPLRDRFEVKLVDGPDLDVHGNLLGHEYHIGQVATVSRKWFRMRNTYGVQVAPGQNDIIILAATVCIDQMTRDIG